MRIIFTIIGLTLTFFVSAQRCGTVDYARQHPSLFPHLTSTPNSVSHGRDTLPGEVIVVPVVFHILYNTGSQNISDQQVRTQLAVLNADYRRRNADAGNTPEPFKGVAADPRISFCLAKVDPNGNYTTGIIHKYTTQSLFLADDEMKFSSSAGDDGWNPQKYLNIWVCNLFGRTLGYAVMPGGPADRDGVVIQYSAFGTMGTAEAPYDKGRTATHEIGHWLGLRHTWGDAVCGDDSIADTPPQQTYSSGCPSFPHLSGCSVNNYGDMFMNYMDFTDDACMNMFTIDQAKEMRGQFATGGFRNSFLNSSVCDSSLAAGGPLPTDSQSISANISLSVYPNPFSNQVTVKFNDAESFSGRSFLLYDVAGKLLMSQKITAQSTTISLTTLGAGMYILRVDGGSSKKIFKLIKENSGQF